MWWWWFTALHLLWASFAGVSATSLDHDTLNLYNETDKIVFNKIYEDLEQYINSTDDTVTTDDKIVNNTIKPRVHDKIEYALPKVNIFVNDKKSNSPRQPRPNIYVNEKKLHFSRPSPRPRVNVFTNDKSNVSRPKYDVQKPSHDSRPIDYRTSEFETLNETVVERKLDYMTTIWKFIARHLKNYKNENKVRIKRKIFGLRNRFPNRTLSYSLFTSTLPHYLEPQSVAAETREAFDIYEKVTDWYTNETILKFVDVGDDNPRATITISFESRIHDDGTFPGKEIMAHAAINRGSIHINNDIVWLMKNETLKMGRKYLPVLLHEIGHLLGFAHSENIGSIMYASYLEGRVVDVNKEIIDDLNRLYMHNTKESYRKIPSYKTNYDKIEYYSGPKMVKFKGENITTRLDLTPEKEFGLTYGYSGLELPAWVTGPSNGIDMVCEKIPTTVAYMLGKFYIFFDQEHWEFNDFDFKNENYYAAHHSEGRWKGLCGSVVSATEFRNQPIFFTKFFRFEYAFNHPKRIIVPSYIYSVIFEEIVNNMPILYGIQHNALYVLDLENDTRTLVSSVFRKFKVDQVDWVILNEQIKMVGYKRGKWMLKQTGYDERVGILYVPIRDIEPLISKC
ncbi:MMP [Plodia interpunctella granulovirus]|uniref:MMP n=1 Tax=Plodia interpunctella granulovirus TaxID=262175 RepID=A0A1L5JGK8_9BBAC|nr:MMP [Plodia interpunctella granulovirus]APO13922.1 MMP [Plodia interpunctella granulovirus]